MRPTADARRSRRAGQAQPRCPRARPRGRGLSRRAKNGQIGCSSRCTVRETTNGTRTQRIPSPLGAFPRRRPFPAVQRTPPQPADGVRPRLRSATPGPVARVGRADQLPPRLRHRLLTERRRGQQRSGTRSRSQRRQTRGRLKGPPPILLLEVAVRESSSQVPHAISFRDVARTTRSCPGHGLQGEEVGEGSASAPRRTSRANSHPRRSGIPSSMSSACWRTARSSNRWRCACLLEEGRASILAGR